MALRHPVTCEQIGQRSLYLGSTRAARQGVVDTQFDHVITVSSSKQPLTTEFIPLVDGPSLSYKQFKQAVDAVRAHYHSDETILVHCEVGISRSAAVIATVLACEEGISFEEALDEVKRYRGRASPRRSLRESGEKYIREVGSPLSIT
ncbi:dual specificity protein phosphatase family protein [Halomarina pelagica]|uniref:dual specificity protein phosphatase family protein n=1 Tax=Halomarina pelagica TaxID=2961599 RepID=UPI0034A23181